MAGVLELWLGGFSSLTGAVVFAFAPGVSVFAAPPGFGAIVELLELWLGVGCAVAPFVSGPGVSVFAAPPVVGAMDGVELDCAWAANALTAMMAAASVDVLKYILCSLG
jgi:hypothetical protein